MKKATYLFLLLFVLIPVACSTGTTRKQGEEGVPAFVACLTERTDEGNDDIDQEGGWEAIIHSAEVSPYLNFSGAGFVPGTMYSNRFVLNDSNSLFVLLTLSLIPIGENNSLCLHEIVINDNESVNYYPFGIDPGGSEAHFLSDNKGFGTSGNCDLVQVTSNGLLINCDLHYDVSNTLGIINSDSNNIGVRNRRYRWHSEVPVSKEPMTTVFYILPKETIESGGLKLKLADSESIELPSCFYTKTVHTMREIGGTIPWCDGQW